MRYTFLLIGEKTESGWPLVLERALSTLGKLSVTSERDAIQSVSQNYYDVFIIDAGAVCDTVRLVSHFRARQPRSRIIVATASPTWQRAREVLQAGAVDYIRKSLDENKLRSEIQAVFDAPLSS